jgi:hypothetical protein
LLPPWRCEGSPALTNTRYACTNCGCNPGMGYVWGFWSFSGGLAGVGEGRLEALVPADRSP